MYGSWIGDGEANCSLQTPLAIVQHDAQRQTRSGGFSVVVSQDAAESLAALDVTTDATDFLGRIDQSVVEALVIALCVIMGQERNRSGVDRFLSEEYQAMQALILKGAHEALDVGR